jgi:ABC-type transporter Mla subunit MlaD
MSGGWGYIVLLVIIVAVAAVVVVALVLHRRSSKKQMQGENAYAPEAGGDLPPWNPPPY